MNSKDIDHEGLGNYRGIILIKHEAQFLKELEESLGKKIKCFNTERPKIEEEIEKIKKDQKSFNYIAEHIPEVPDIVSSQLKNVLKEAKIKEQFENCYIVKSHNIISINIANYKKYENITAEIPPSIETLSELVELRLYRFKSIPKNILKLINLKFLSIVSHELKEIPDYICNLISLEELEILTDLKKLPDNIGNLINLRKLSLHRNKIEILPDTIGNLKNLKELDLYGNKISKFPETLGNLENLETIDIRENPFKSLPESFGNLKSIKELCLSSQKLNKLPESFGKLENLTQLEIQKSLSKLPNSFGDLKKLKTLKINCSGLKTLPLSFGNLDSLDKLDLRCHTLMNLPQTFGNLKNLETLNLVCVELRSLPDMFSQLENLKEFNLTSVDFVKLPENFGDLKGLKKLNLNKIGLVKLPNSFGNLQNLEQLNISGNKIKTLPESFKNLKKLKDLEINQNLFDILPAPIGYLENIIDFKILSQTLTSLPNSIGNMKNLEKFEIRAELQNIPESFGDLKKLKSLKVSRNQLEQLPETFGNLISLIELDLSNNKISKLPNSFNKLKNLEILNLEDNKISELPNGFGNLTSLISLKLRNNKLEFLPEILKDLDKLEILDLYNNHLKKLPSNLSNLKSLKTLDLTKNQLKEVPESLGELISLKRLDLDNNSLEYLPITICKLRNLERLNVSKNNLRKFPDIAQKLENLKNIDINDNAYLSIDDAIFNLYNKKDIYFYLWTDNINSRYVSPNFIESNNPKIKREVKKIFLNSIEEIQNIDEFIIKFLDGSTTLKDYILKLGTRPLDVINVLLQQIEDLEKKAEIIKLGKEIEEKESKKDIKVQFIRLCEHFGTLTYPMGILYLSAMLKKALFTDINYYELFWFKKIRIEQEKLRENVIPAFNSWNLRFYSDEEIEKYEKEYEINLKNRNPHILFIGPITTNYLPFFIDILPNLRRLCPESIIIAGGPHFGINSLFDIELKEKFCKDLDGFVIGEAEEVVVEILEILYNQFRDEKNVVRNESIIKKLSKVKGLFIRNESFKERDYLFDLNVLPFPDYDILVDFVKSNPFRLNNYSLAERRNPIIGSETGVVEDYSRPGDAYYQEDIHYFSRYYKDSDEIPYAVIVGSRECPYQCSFCASHKKPRRVRSSINIFEEIKLLYEYLDIKLFIFFDPLYMTFSEKEIERVEKLNNLIIRNDLDIKYSIEIRADVINKIPEDTLIRIIESGCTQFNLGLEKGSDRALQRFQKSMTIEEHENAIRKIRSASFQAYNHKEDSPSLDVLINGTFILGGPDETKDDIKDTLSHGFKLDIDGLRFFPLEIHPGTEIYNQAINNRILSSGLKSYLDSENYPIYETSILTKDYLFQVQEMAERVIEDKNQIRYEYYELKKNWKNMDDYYNKVEEYIRKIDSTYKRFINSVLDLIKKL